MLTYADGQVYMSPLNVTRALAGRSGVFTLKAFALSADASKGTQFTCFTGTKVQILTQRREQRSHFTCFTGTKVQILTQKALSKAPSPLVSGVYAAVEVCADPVISPDSGVVVPMEGERVSIKV
jgi:hypothetical protein